MLASFAIGLVFILVALAMPYALAVILPVSSYVLYKRVSPRVGIAFLTVTLIIPVGFYYLRKAQYLYLCSSVELKSNGRAEDVEGILAVDHAQFAAHAELKAGIFYYIETRWSHLRPGVGRYFPTEYAWLTNLTPRQIELRKETHGHQLSRYAFERSEATDIDWLYPSIQVSQLRILDSQTGTLLAEARDYQFGGGIIGWYWAYFVTGSPVELCDWNLPRGPGWIQYMHGPRWFTWPMEWLDDDARRARGRAVEMRDREFLKAAITPVKRWP